MFTSPSVFTFYFGYFSHLSDFLFISVRVLFTVLWLFMGHQVISDMLPVPNILWKKNFKSLHLKILSLFLYFSFSLLLCFHLRGVWSVFARVCASMCVLGSLVLQTLTNECAFVDAGTVFLLTFSCTECLHVEVWIKMYDACYSVSICKMSSYIGHN